MFSFRIFHNGRFLIANPKGAKYLEPDPPVLDFVTIVQPDSNNQEDDPIVEQSFVIQPNDGTTYTNDIFSFDGGMYFGDYLGTSFNPFDHI